MVRETRLSVDDLIYPLFISDESTGKWEIPSMPGQYRWSLLELEREIELVRSLRIPAVLLFGIPAKKDEIGSDNFAEKGVVQRAIRLIKRVAPELIVITDVCMCEFTSHGHCGLVNRPGTEYHQPLLPEGYVLNDQTLEILNRVAISHAHCGADIVAPSGMIDGMVGSIRAALDARGYSHVGVLAYSVKYASAFYGPFRDAAGGAPQFGDRSTHQMDAANIREAIKEARLDVAQGCDLLMVKPALSYLDVIAAVRNAFSEMPLVAYNVSGEYAMIKAAIAQGWLDEKRIVPEVLLSIKRAGADMIITYFAKEICQWLDSQ
jgi:porphobilinogen synthase